MARYKLGQLQVRLPMAVAIVVAQESVIITVYRWRRLSAGAGMDWTASRDGRQQTRTQLFTPAAAAYKHTFTVLGRDGDLTIRPLDYAD